MFPWVHVKFSKKLGHIFIIIMNKKKCAQKIEKQSCSHNKSIQREQKTVAWIFAPNEPSSVNMLSKAIRFPTKGLRELFSPRELSIHTSLSPS